MSRPKLYELKLHESPVLDGGRNYERFSLDWLLEVEVDTEADTDTENDPNSSSSKIPLLVLKTGDVIYIPELATGAGEFEGMRFIGKKQQHQQQKKTTDIEKKNHDKLLLLPLLQSSVQYPEFPPEIITQELYPTNDLLRDAYERIFDTMLSRMVGGGPDTLKDIMGGGDAELDEYWSNPPITRPSRKGTEQEPQQQWIIPLKLCQIAEIA